jgi:hypothetical protein
VRLHGLGVDGVMLSFANFKDERPLLIAGATCCGRPA